MKASKFDSIERLWRRYDQRLLAVLPWASLVLGIAGAWWMDRSPRSAPFLAAGAIAVWLALVLFTWMQHGRPAARESAMASLPEEGGAAAGEVEGRAPSEPAVAPAVGPELGRSAALRDRFRRVAGTPLFRRAMAMTGLSALQSLAQTCLFFSLPFYAQASVLSLAEVDLGHVAFLLTLAAAGAVSLWDPWTEAVLRRPQWSTLLPAISSFAALDVVLPMLGLSTQGALWCATLLACLGALLLCWFGLWRRTRAPRPLLVTLAVAVSVPLALWLGLARVIPPAPLRLVRAEFGIEVRDKWVAEALTHLAHAPERLICATAIGSPVGVHDRVFHIWEKNGKVIQRLEVEIVGGRLEGYRTRSWLKEFGAAPGGVYSCRVATGSGQVLGTRRIRIDGA